MKISYLPLIGYVLSLLTSNVLAQTEVGGNYEENQHWTVDGSPYIVVSDVSIWQFENQLLTLTIDPGVEVYFDQSQLQVFNLIAEGTEEQPIRFAPTEDNVYHYWSMLAGDASFDYCIVENGDVGGYFDGLEGVLNVTRFANIRNSKFTNLYPNAIKSFYNINLKDSYIEVSGYRGGITQTDSRGTVNIERTVFYGVDEDRSPNAGAIIAFSTNPVVIDHCTFVNLRTAISSNHKVVTNSIFLNNVSTFAESNNSEISNNCFWNNGTIDTNLEGFSETNDVNANGHPCDRYGNIFARPRLVEVGSYPEYFSLMLDSPCIDAGNPDFELDPDMSSTDIGAIYYHQDNIERSEFSLEMSENWSTVSLPIVVPNANIVEMFSELVDNETLIIVKDMAGHFYVPEFGFNNIPFWDYSLGYQVKLTEATSLEFLGREIPANTEIPLSQGWSIVPYYPEVDVDARVAFANIVDNLSIVKDEDGNFYVPEQDFSNMGDLTRGKGYQVRVSARSNLVWNVPNDADDEDDENANFSMNKPVKPTYYQPVTRTGNNMSILISFNGLQIDENEHVEIGAFNENGLCVGAAVLNGNNRIGLAVWGDDLMLDEIKGMRNSELISFRFSNGKVLDYEEPVRFERDGFTTFTIGTPKFIPESYYITAAYPNPFNSTTRLNYGLPEASRISLKVFDINGRLVANLFNGEREAGAYSAVWNAQTVSSGVYFIRIESNNFKNIQKVMLLR